MNVTADNRESESVIEQFEVELLKGNRPDIDHFLPTSSADRAYVLKELVMAELEQQIKSGQPARIESWLDRYPEICQQPDSLAILLRFEFLIRRRFEDGFDPSEYAVRFPEVHECLSYGPEVYWDEIHRDDLIENRVPASGDGLQHRTRFVLGDFHAEGGLGTVWTATDVELKRTVAIKAIKPHYSDDERIQRRFSREAVITGQLEHPGIVPIYGAGHFDDGTPYYAMRYVDGKNLRDCINEFHQKRRSKSGFDSVEFRRLLTQFVDVCKTIHFAHSRGVLHRDIKPQNILIGDFGETLVVDWGLAKTIGLSEEDRGAKDEIRPTGDRSEQVGRIGKPADSESPTAMGDIIGSPGYMSPEQARGDHNSVAPASDIYSLGATLKTVLINGVPGGPHERKGPAPLNSICTRAMSENPRDRYATALAIADDVERFLAGEAVKAHPESLGAKAARLLIRHKKLVWAIGVLSLALAVVSTVFAISLNQHVTRNHRFIEKLHELVRHSNPSVEFLRGAEKIIAVEQDSFNKGMWLTSIAEGYARNEEYSDAVRLVEHSLEIFAGHPHVDSHHELGARSCYARWLGKMRQYEQGFDIAMQTIQHCRDRNLVGQDIYIDALCVGSSLARSSGRDRLSSELAQEGLHLAVARHTEKDYRTIPPLVQLAATAIKTDQLTSAKGYIDRILATVDLVQEPEERNHYKSQAAILTDRWQKKDRGVLGDIP